MKGLRRSRPDHAEIKRLMIGLRPIDALLRDLLSFTPSVDAFLTNSQKLGTTSSGPTGSTRD